MSSPWSLLCDTTREQLGKPFPLQKVFPVHQSVLRIVIFYKSISLWSPCQRGRTNNFLYQYNWEENLWGKPQWIEMIMWGCTRALQNIPNIQNIFWKMIRLRYTIILEDSWNIKNTGNYWVVVIQKIGWIIKMWVHEIYMRALENIKKMGGNE